jgi:uncharacterized protein YecT (DUF1311 family)
MRALALALIILASPAHALDEAQILGACYRDCDKEASSGADYQACLARAADTADALLNDEFKALQDSLSTAAKEVDVRPEPQLEALKDVQDKWLGFRNVACTLEDTLSFGAPAGSGRLSSCICALSYGRINDFTRMRHTLLGR